MANRLLVFLMLLVVSLAAFGPVRAQTPPDPARPATSPAGTPPAPAAQGSDSSPAATQSPAPPSAPAASAAPAPASADTLKKARLAGYHPETRKGATVYCRESANLGTRFPTKTCLDEAQLKSVVDNNNQNQDSLRKPAMCAGSGCAGH